MRRGVRLGPDHTCVHMCTHSDHVSSMQNLPCVRRIPTRCMCTLYSTRRLENHGDMPGHGLMISFIIRPGSSGHRCSGGLGIPDDRDSGENRDDATTFHYSLALAREESYDSSYGGSTAVHSFMGHSRADAGNCGARGALNQSLATLAFPSSTIRIPLLIDRGS